MSTTIRQLVRRSATEWAADPVNHKQVKRLARARLDNGSFLDPSPAAAFSPFELFYQLIEPKKFTREGATEFWDQFRFELPDNLAEQDEIVLMFCDAALEAVE